tara:strand:- start:521 stop:1189 length:669 start_codon:yes stop_codon:yes gene_type:complete
MKTEYTFKINAKLFETSNPIINGQQILELAGLDPAQDFELLQRINERGFEPVQLDEMVDLREMGIEGFRAKPYKHIPIVIDGKTIKVEECFMTPLEILELAEKDPQDFFLKEIRNGDVEVGYREDLDHKVGLNRRSVFVTCPIKLAYQLIVNARPETWSEEIISYEEVIILAFGSISSNPNICYTVNYKRGPKGNTEGSLVKGQSVKVQQKMVFNVTRTDKS